jgi:putative inorganic carbon (HCO3(-)) transporter
MPIIKSAPREKGWKTTIRRAAGFVDRWQWLILIVAAPAFLFPSAGRSPLLAIVPLVWLAALAAGRNPIPSTPLNGSLLLMAVMVLVSLYATYDIAVSLAKVSGVLLGIAAFYLVVRIGSSERGWWACLAAFILAGLGVTLASLVGTDWFTNKFFIVGKIVALMPKVLSGLPGAAEGFHPSEVAGALIWVVPGALLAGLAWLAPYRTMKKAASGRWIWAVVALDLSIAVIMGIVVLLTQSRSALLGLLVAGLVVLWLILPQIGRRAMEWVMLAGILAIVTFLYVNPEQARQLAGLSGSAASMGGTFSLSTMNGRLEVWSRAIYGIQDFPLTGMGMNTFRTVVKELYPLFMVGSDFDIGHAHNEFLQAALDLGIPGLVAFIGLYIGATAMLFATWKEARRLEAAQLAANRPAIVLTKYATLGLGGGLLAHFIYGLTDTVALGAKPGLLYWMLLGLIVGLYLHSRQNGFIRWPFHKKMS